MILAKLVGRPEGFDHGAATEGGKLADELKQAQNTGACAVDDGEKVRS